MELQTDEDVAVVRVFVDSEIEQSMRCLIDQLV
jgi:hypothetical protein